MKVGSIVLTPLPQADGQVKNRPALVLAHFHPFGDLLVCGVSTQLRLAVSEFDEIIPSDAPDFASTGLMAPSVVRLGFLSTIPVSMVKGAIGHVDSERYRRLLNRLIEHLSTFR